MRIAFYVLAVVGVCAAFFAGFAILDWAHRMKRNRVRGVANLPRSKISSTEEIPTALAPANAIERLAAAFADRSPFIAHRTDRELVMYWGQGGGLSQFRGIASIRPEQMPIQLAAEVRNGSVRVLVDEDFGFHLFVGPARAIYDDLYREALDQALALARAQVRGN